MVEQSPFSKNYEEAEIDPFSAPPAGYSLTQPQGKWPWEQPSRFVDIEEAFDFILSKLVQPQEKMDFLRLMDAGIPIETITRTITFSAFTKGIVNPDLAELLVVPVSLFLLTEARRAGITPKFNNNIELNMISNSDIMGLMEELNPERYKEYLSGEALREESDEEKEEEVTEKDMSFMGIAEEKDNE